MNSIILCEGNDDLWMIGYFLHKACSNKWVPDPNGKISENFDFPRETRREKSILYSNGIDKLGICSVGGKDSFKKYTDFILKMNSNHPNERFEQVVIIRDRDSDDEEEIINQFQEYFQNYEDIDYQIQENICLKDKENVPIEYIKRDNKYIFNVALNIIPFDGSGCLETILSKSISLKGNEEKIICDLASKYIEDYIGDVEDRNYIKTPREEIKAKFSSLMAIINPTSSTQIMSDIFMEFEWEKSSYICDSFKLLKDLFS